MLDRGVMVAQGPAEVERSRRAPGCSSGDDGGVAEKVAEELTARNQTVVMADVELDQRESWEALLKTLPGDVPFNGVVHLVGLDGQGIQASTPEFAEATKRTGASALALVQGLLDADAAPEKGVWFVTRGAQTLDHEPLGEPSGAMLWGFGKVVAREAGHLHARMLDLEAGARLPVGALADELLYPDARDAHRVPPRTEADGAADAGPGARRSGCVAGRLGGGCSRRTRTATWAGSASTRCPRGSWGRRRYAWRSRPPG